MLIIISPTSHDVVCSWLKELQMTRLALEKHGGNKCILEPFVWEADQPAVLSQLHMACPCMQLTCDCRRPFLP